MGMWNHDVAEGPHQGSNVLFSGFSQGDATAIKGEFGNLRGVSGLS